MRQSLLRAAPFALLAVAGCVAPKAPPPPPPAPAPPPPQPTPVLDWTDAPLTPGSWTWTAGTARFSDATGAAPLLRVSCEAATRTIRFAVRAPGAATSLTVTASDGSFAYPAAPAGDGTIVARANASDPNLDKLAFSRGRFALSAAEAGLSRIVLPARPELGRVIDDCRR